MNALSHDLARAVRAREEAAPPRPRFGQRLHLMPPVGWLNDPNGLCELDGVFHAFFQYAPLDAAGGVKMWGHAASRDLISWEHDGAVLFPDEPFDVHGVYSGSAIAEDGRIRVLYTGNVKLPDPDGAYDFVYAGREANTVLAETADGRAFGPKRLVMTNADYPADLSCHVRDPKVWREGDRYLMVQGARRRVDASSRPCAAAALHGPGAGADAGEVLVFSSPDLVRWELVNRVRTPERFGFMWECPDCFELAGAGGGAPVRVLSVSPQGLEGGDWDRRNVYQSGYFTYTGAIDGACELGGFHLWDAGFDFYAPQSLRAEDGRRILIGWMGMPDAPYGNDPTVELEGWQHCLSLPREVEAAADGRVLQRPVRELAARRGAVRRARGSLEVSGEDARAFDLVVEGCGDGFEAVVCGGLELSWRPAEGALPARLELRFRDAARTGMGCGRDVRWEPLERLERIRAVGDSSSLEVFANDGELCMSTRLYPDARSLAVTAPCADIACWRLA